MLYSVLFQWPKGLVPFSIAQGQCKAVSEVTETANIPFIVPISWDFFFLARRKDGKEFVYPYKNILSSALY